MSDELNVENVGDGNEQPTGDAPGEQSGDAVVFSAGQQSLMDKIIGERLARAKEKWDADAEKAQAKAQEKAEQERLKAQAEWQKLAEQHEGELNEIKPRLETATAKLELYTEALNNYLQAARDGVASHITALLDRLDPVEQLQWLTEHGEELGKPQAPSLDAGVGSNEEPHQRRTDEQKQALADALGLSVEYIPDE